MKIKKITAIFLTVLLLSGAAQPLQADTLVPSELYSLSACLMDAESGRILHEKNGSEQRAMASTTKIMSCILALELGNLEDTVEVSKYAATMPDVQLNIRAGEKYILGDLLYSLMLESHNDTAVAVAEHIGGSVEGFAALMNQKAIDIGCYDTFFITPSGLDATDGKGKHSSTAVDMAKIMAYCIKESPKKDEFIKITTASDHSFSDVKGKRNFSVRNKNAFLSMMEGAFSGKTGFTSDAGYCYVGALERDGKVLIVAVLAAGWPNNKRYKWSDTRKLMQYGLDNYQYRTFDEMGVDHSKLKPIHVTDGQTDRIGEKSTVSLKVNENVKKGSYKIDGESKEIKGLLIRKDEKIKTIYDLPDAIDAPVERGEVIGSVKYMVDGELWKVDNIVAEEAVKKIDFRWCFERIGKMFLL